MGHKKAQKNEKAQKSAVVSEVLNKKISSCIQQGNPFVPSVCFVRFCG